MGGYRGRKEEKRNICCLTVLQIPFANEKYKVHSNMRLSREFEGYLLRRKVGKEIPK